jgi:hypothetical protein
MAATNGGYSTGAGKDEAELRRRNVDSFEKANGQHVYKVEAEDKKKLQKVGPIYKSVTPNLTTHLSPRAASCKFSTSGSS